ncbi:hypothetical protein BaRGS_00008253 [Batillaria attramentaria]|uniref:Uncharacterized protein n=1 Tax=Batillaria attramentaria TaxID=370345 RepID=A0ABD0LM72_9CAEN
MGARRRYLEEGAGADNVQIVTRFAFLSQRNCRTARTPRRQFSRPDATLGTVVHSHSHEDLLLMEADGEEERESQFESRKRGHYPRWTRSGKGGNPIREGYGPSQLYLAPISRRAVACWGEAVGCERPLSRGLSHSIHPPRFSGDLATRDSPRRPDAPHCKRASPDLEQWYMILGHYFGWKRSRGSDARSQEGCGENTTYYISSLDN